MGEVEVNGTKKRSELYDEKGVLNTETTVKALPVAEPAALGLIGLAVAALVLASADLKFASGVAEITDDPLDS